jgi:MFS transporter, SP family, general alpha glucoside:H+ symporter
MLTPAPGDISPENNHRDQLLLHSAFSGNSMRAYSTYFFEHAGLPTDQSFNMSIVGYSLGMAGVIIPVSLYLYDSFSRLLGGFFDVFLLPWFLVPNVGQRTLYILGLTWMGGLSITIDGIGIPQGTLPTPAPA